MFASHAMNFWYPLYHYMRMGESLENLSTVKWITKGVPVEYLNPSDDIEVMHDSHAFHDFRQRIIAHLYNEYVEEWDSDDD